MGQVMNITVNHTHVDVGGYSRRSYYEKNKLPHLLSWIYYDILSLRKMTKHPSHQRHYWVHVYDYLIWYITVQH